MELFSRRKYAVEIDKHHRRPELRGCWQREGENEKHEALLALPQPPNPDDIDRICGHAVCAVPACDECGKDNLEAVVALDASPEFEHRTAHYCRHCLGKAIGIFEDLKITRF